MKKNQSEDDGPLHQTVAEGFEFKVGAKSIAVEFAGQKLSAHAGSATFWGWLHSTNWAAVLGRQLPHPPPLSNNHLTPVAKALAFTHGLLGEARKLTHVAYFRRDPVVPELLGIRRVASASTLSRFFSGFTAAGKNLTCFRPLWRWGLDRLPSRKEGYTLDLDSTRLLHEDGHQDGVRAGYTRLGLKPCLHPLLAVISAARLVAQLWLRSGNATCGNNTTAFFLDLWHNLPRHVRLRGVRADSGFCLPELLDLWEQLRLPYVVAAQLSEPIKGVLRGGLVWASTEVRGTDVAEMAYQTLSWSQPRRLILIRHRVAERPEAGGKKLIDVPGYVFQALVTSLPAREPPLAVWRYYNGRADCENVIKELQQGFALTTLCLQSFWATEAALSLATLTYNLTVLFQRHLGWHTKVTIHTLRFWLFVTPGIIAHPAGKTTIKLAVPPRERGWWRRLWEKILSPLPNCNAVENRPAFSH
jgi:Transposase DDE domain group 1